MGATCDDCEDWIGGRETHLPDLRKRSDGRREVRGGQDKSVEEPDSECVLPRGHPSVSDRARPVVLHPWRREPSPRWGDRVIVKQQQGVVLLERKHCDFAVAFDSEKTWKQRIKFYLYPTNRFTKTEARAAAMVDFKRRVSR